MTNGPPFALGDDAPKTVLSEDELNYSPFAKQITQAVISLNAPNGYVIGLHGAWGSGKSTVLNFVGELLQQHNRENADNAIVHLDFRPWLITGNQDLIAAFFKILSEKLDNGRPERCWIKRLFRRAKKDKADLVVETAAAIAAAVDPSGLGIVATLRATAKSATAALIKRPSLQKAYNELRGHLVQSNQRFLVTIDDIDRLEDGDIKHIMRMVKSIGQLPNVVYLLAYDPRIVANAYGEPPTLEALLFTEKIVQQEITLPKPAQDALFGMLDKHISFLLEDTPDSLHWEHIRRDGVRRWIRSPRDVVRLSNSLKFSWAALQGEIDPQDLLAIEGIRLFDFEVFTWLRESQDLLFSQGRFIVPREEEEARAIDNLRQSIPESKRDAVLTLVKHLFPQIAIDEKGTAVRRRGIEFNDLTQRRGIGSEAGYDSYFALYPSPNAIPLPIVNSLVSDSISPEEAESRIQEYIAKNDHRGKPLVLELIDELSARFTGTQRTTPQQALLFALFERGEEIISLDHALGWFSTPPAVRLDLLISSMLTAWGPSSAEEHLISAYRKTESPTYLADNFVWRGRELKKFESDGRETPKITNEAFDTLGGILSEKISRAHERGTLAYAPFYFNIVRVWSFLVDPDTPKAWMTDGVQNSAEFMAKTCRGLVSVSQPQNQSEPRFNLSDRPPVPPYPDLGVLVAAGEKHLSNPNLTPEQHSLIQAVTIGCKQFLENPT